MPTRSLPIWRSQLIGGRTLGLVQSPLWFPEWCELHPGNTFARQAIPMTWDFVECNSFSAATGNVKRRRLEWISQSY